ncbi:hypothetical protein EW026_g6705 [Hermanssonia centrifuga]|uniref:Uncharacterized protein n=1 Tax=Hermanssonia centrifuga TaxID=98765 RepID=A0A4S4KA59_9APHY|nr:hypothetical protein EW026_g6705 [Hermanssonia centrifuga]
MPVPLLNTTVDTPAIEVLDAQLIAVPSLLPGPSSSSEPAAYVGHGDSEGNTGPLSMAGQAGNVAAVQLASGATSADHSHIAPAGELEPGNTDIGLAPPEATANEGALADTPRDDSSSSTVQSSKKAPARSQIFQPGSKETARNIYGQLWKTVNPNATNAEFTKVWQAMSKRDKKVYEAQAKASSKSLY